MEWGPSCGVWGTEVSTHWLHKRWWWCVFHMSKAGMSDVKSSCLNWVRKTTLPAETTCNNIRNLVDIRKLKGWKIRTALSPAWKKKPWASQRNRLPPLTVPPAPSLPHTGPVDWDSWHWSQRQLQWTKQLHPGFLDTCARHSQKTLGFPSCRAHPFHFLFSREKEESGLPISQSKNPWRGELPWLSC